MQGVRIAEFLGKRVSVFDSALVALPLFGMARGGQDVPH